MNFQQKWRLCPRPQGSHYYQPRRGHWIRRPCRKPCRSRPHCSSSRHLQPMRLLLSYFSKKGRFRRPRFPRRMPLLSCHSCSGSVRLPCRQDPLYFRKKSVWRNRHPCCHPCCHPCRRHQCYRHRRLRCHHFRCRQCYRYRRLRYHHFRCRQCFRYRRLPYGGLRCYYLCFRRYLRCRFRCQYRRHYRRLHLAFLSSEGLLSRLARYPGRIPSIRQSLHRRP